MSDVRPTKVIRIIARLNVGGPAKHVVWLTSGLREAGYNSLLVAGKVPEGEDEDPLEDMFKFTTTGYLVTGGKPSTKSCCDADLMALF